MNSMLNNKLDKAMTTEQFTEVVDAILEGKYSWACVLILRFAGYNPLHYIPYRTYNRLMKDNCKDDKRHHKETKLFPNQKNIEQKFQKSTNQIQDLSYIESIKPSQNLIKGGFNSSYFDVYPSLEFLKFRA